jgi:Family of unknown function (DUF6152)
MRAILNGSAVFGLIVGFSALWFADSAAAHHSIVAEYDVNKPIKLTGKVTQMKWSNPHGWIYLDVADPNGKVVNWALETSSANSLYRRGWRKEDLPVGTLLTIEGWRSRTSPSTGSIGVAVLPDGRKLFAGSATDTTQKPAP